MKLNIEFEDEIDELKVTQQNIRDTVEVKKDARKEATNKLNEWWKKWKKTDESIYSGIDNILQRSEALELSAVHTTEANLMVLMYEH